MDQLSASVSSMWVTVHFTSQPSSSGLVSGPVVGAAQTLIWCYSCMFLLWCLHLSVLVCFLLQELSLSFIYSIEIKSAYLIMWIQPSACTTGGNVLVLFLSHLPLDFTCGFISTSACESSTGVCSWGSPGGLGCAPGGTECGVGAVAWIAGALAGPGTQGSRGLGQEEIWCP